MSRPIRIHEGRFGRVTLLEAGSAGASRSCPELMVVLKYDGADSRYAVGAEQFPFTRDDVVLVNANETHEHLGAPDGAPIRLLAVHLAPGWLRERFPALQNEDGRPFPRPHEAVTVPLRRLADTLAVEILNDQFLAAERVEFMLQELLLSIVENYLARRRASSPLWRGSRFADQRIRRAIGLLRARPNKDVNIDDLAGQVGLSRSRFYDLFQICTGLSPRASLDMLCVETAIARLAAGGGRIADVSAELRFSAQSNFTRFFLNQVGIPPSAYRRASARRGPREPRGRDDPPSD
jgi:AraC-like DNA-binding protein